MLGYYKEYLLLGWGSFVLGSFSELSNFRRTRCYVRLDLLLGSTFGYTRLGLLLKNTLSYIKLGYFWVPTVVLG